MANLMSSRDQLCFPEILADARLMEYDDSRDHTYDLRRLIHWDAYGIVSIKPNYRLSRSESAVISIRCATRRTYDNVCCIIEALEISMDATALLGHAGVVA